MCFFNDSIGCRNSVYNSTPMRSSYSTSNAHKSNNGTRSVSLTTYLTGGGGGTGLGTHCGAALIGAGSKNGMNCSSGWVHFMET